MHFEIANPKPQNALKSWHAVRPAYAYVVCPLLFQKKIALCLFVQCINPKPLNPKPQNALNPWHAVKPAYAYACLSIAVQKQNPYYVYLSNA